MVLAQIYKASKLALSDTDLNRRLGFSSRRPCARVVTGLLKTPRTQLEKQAKMAQHWYLYSNLWSEVTWIEICASLNHRKKMKAEPNRLIPLKPIENLLEQCFSKWVESPPWGRFWWARGRKNQRGRYGGEKHQGGENAQPLIDHWVNFSILVLWLVSCLQILIYYESLEIVAQAIYLLKFYSGSSMCPATVWDYFRAAEPSQKCHSSASRTLFINMAPAPKLSFFMAQTPASASIRFHTLIF